MAIIEQGETSDSLFLILSGAIEAFSEDVDGTRTALRRQGAGEFFGELGIAGSVPRTATVISAEPVTCLVFSRRAATAWEGRGADASLIGSGNRGLEAELVTQAGTVVIDVRPHIGRKVAALAAHRSQYPIDPAMFPRWLVEEMMGHEWFVQVQPRVEPATDLFA